MAPAAVTAHFDVIKSIGVANLCLLRTVDFSPGGTVRVGVSGDDKITLTISHSNTKESPPFGSRRSIVRLDIKRVDADGRPAVLSAYSVIVHPNAQFTDAEAVQAARSLAFLLIHGDNGGSTLPLNGLVPEFTDRVVQGEP